jgi:hypothetical protein
MDEMLLPMDMNAIRMRRGLSLLVCMAALVGCSANSGGPAIASGASSGADARAPSMQFAVKPTSIAEGQSAMLSWAITNATSCHTDGAWNDADILGGSSSSTGVVSVPGVYAYGLTCTGPGGTQAASVTLSVGAVPAPQVTLQLAQASIRPGNAPSLTWSTSRATSCTASGGSGSWSGNVALSNLNGFNPGVISTDGEYVYAMTCIGPGGQSTASQILTVSSSSPVAAPRVAFAANPSTVAPGGAVTLSWSTTGATSCGGTGGTGSDGWIGGQPLNDSGVVLGPLLVAGDYSFVLTCRGAGGASTQVADVIVAAGALAPAPTAQISVDPATIPAGTSARLSWATTNASVCTGSGSWSGSEPTLGSAVSTGTLTIQGIYSYVLNCSGVGGSVTASTQLTVGPPLPSIGSFSATPTTVTAGGSIALSWSTANATTCVASGGSGLDGWTGAEPTSGSGMSVGPILVPGSYSYVLTCSGAGGVSTPGYVTVTVQPTIGAASISSLLAVPSAITTGQSTTLSWVSVDANSCTASGGTGSDGWSGSVASSNAGQVVGPLNVAGTYIYTLNCSGAGGSSGPSSATVSVSAPLSAAVITSLAAVPNVIVAGGSTTLSWLSTHASSCTGSGGTGSDGWARSQPTSDIGLPIGPIAVAGNYTYTLNCSGSGGASGDTSVTVAVGAVQPPAAIGSFTATPTSIQTGATVALSWSSSNASSCTASGGTGSDGWSGAEPTSSSSTVIGPINTAGDYVYTLTCSGAGGSSGPSSVDVMVAAPTPAASITSLAASPNSIEVGQSTTLSWSTSHATGCTASGGTGSDNWDGPQLSSSTGTVIGPINSVGSYTYTLDCTGPGGSSGPSSATVSVGPVTPAAAVSSFAITPASIEAGQSSTASWSTSNATGCTASGGAGGDGWTGSVATSSTGTVIGPVVTAGSYTYTLDCDGPGGASGPVSRTLTVTTPPPASPTIAITANGANPAVGSTGQTITLAWSTTNATSCTASGGTGSDGWTGSEPTSSMGTATGAIDTAGSYTYTLTCSGPGGSGSASVNVQVTGSTVVDCGVGVPSKQLLAPTVTASSSVTGLCLLNCGTANLGNVTNSSTSDYATMSVAVGVAAIVGLSVTDNSNVYPAGRKAGFLTALPSSLLSLSLLGNVTIETLLSGQVQESATRSNLLQLQALGLFSNPDEGWIEFTTTKAFNEVRLDLVSTVGALFTLQVYGACVTTQ